ncbi:23S rRNA (uracil(1939)-C(5))-methyltransferase RlmD [Proteiniclasticum sp. QWL-01]|uniref:23S rRNA (uracil(1939)-C(5))-methyltransferase RlmD n=1 Tax=Proteiniclasticum sp. QWL-01 TaxID=3036945 RepID=UPI002410C265|nr:23S rRNA (uracil(1939)-C(5))-methyltransferase RlmD [Proteiniclasticum sp. QWL-01]WFF73646.1 23S rRNA (uracil(1939)-C(5))-methyltransferase RlmD [Proteiniclasticum sp. QWL-01]
MNKTQLVNVKPPCIYYERCGGCQLQHLSNESQNQVKQEIAEKYLSSFGKVEDILVMEHPYEYRNKIQYSFGYGRKKELIAGMYAENSHSIIDIDQCIIQDPQADRIIHTTKKIMKKYKMEPYQEDRETGFLRHVLIRTGFTTGEVMVVLVTAHSIFTGKKNFIQLLTKEHPEITTIIMNINNRSTSMILGDKETTISGKGYIEDILCGMRFRISSKSFYQINPKQTEVLYNTALKMADFKGNERILDAYSGIGTISLIAARQVREVIGVEVNPDGVRDAIKNAQTNQVNNVHFYQADAGEFMQELARRNEPIDAVIMDPPRSGSDETFLNSLCSLKPQKIIYISCNPETQARDLEYLLSHGYRVQKIQPVDMFPQTSHVETVVLITRENK